MLNQVPTAIRTAARNVTLRHPNAMDCHIYRRSVVRTAGAEDGASPSGAPTLGGAGVMDTEDENEVDYTDLGAGRILFGGVYVPTDLSDRRDAAEGAVGEAQIEPIEAGAFECKDGDLVMVMPGGGVVLTYEVTKILNTVNIPPYVPKYEVTPQGDLMFVPEVAADQAARP